MIMENIKKQRKNQIVSEEQRKELLSDFNRGMRSIDLIGKYKVTNARIYQILAECEALGLQVNYKK